MSPDPYRLVRAGGYRIVRAGAQRLNVFGSTDSDDAIRLAREHWTECQAIDSAALEAIDRGEATVADELDGAS